MPVVEDGLSVAEVFGFGLFKQTQTAARAGRSRNFGSAGVAHYVSHLRRELSATFFCCAAELTASATTGTPTSLYDIQLMRTPPVEVGSRVELDAVDLVAGGDAIARLSGFPVFVPSLYPGDRARVEIVEVKSGFARGVVDELLAPGPQRRALPCPIATECGGCDWTELRLDYQLEAKKRILSDSLRRVGKLDPDSLPPLAVHPSPLNYRLRSRLHFSDDERRPGFFAMRTNRVVPLAPECEVVGPQTLRHLGDLENLAKEEESGGSIETFENGSDFAASIA